MPAIRTCIACRQQGEREHLVRLVAGPTGEVLVDLKARLPGRGAWVHATRGCLEQASRRGRLGRALRTEVDPIDLLSSVRGAAERALGAGLSQAAAGGSLVGGHDALEDALRRGRVAEVVTASDASERTLSSLRRAADPGLHFTRVSLDRAALGQRVGSPARAALGVLPATASTHLLRQLRRLRDLG